MLVVNDILTLDFPCTPSPHEQILQRIRVSIPDTQQQQANQHSPRPLYLAYQDQSLHSPSHPLTRDKIAQVFGPTFESPNGNLVFPGVGFECNDKLDSQRVTSVCIFQGQKGQHGDNELMLVKSLEDPWVMHPTRTMAGTVARCEIQVSHTVCSAFHLLHPLT